jgi:hypothetical protein
VDFRSLVSFCVIIHVFTSIAFEPHINLRTFIGHEWFKPSSSRICNRYMCDFIEYSCSVMWNSRCHSSSIPIPPMTLRNGVNWRKWKHLYVRCWTAVTRYRYCCCYFCSVVVWSTASFTNGVERVQKLVSAF